MTPKYESFITDDGYLIEEDNYLETQTVAEGGDPQFELECLPEGKPGVMHDLITVKKISDDLLLKEGVPDESPDNIISVSETIRIWLQDAWDAISSDTGYNAKGKYYSDYIDVESFARMFLIQEYVKSYDCRSGSIFYHRDGMTDSDKLIAGPIWDLDNSLGANQKHKYQESVADRRSGEGAFLTEVPEYEIAIYLTLWKHEDFRNEVIRQYNLHQSAFDDLPAVVLQMISEIESSAEMNFGKVDEITDYNLHRYTEDTVHEPGTKYEQHMFATNDFRSDWADYSANLVTYVKARSLWFRDTYSYD